MTDADDEKPQTASLFQVELAGLIVDAIKLTVVIVTVVAVVPRGSDSLISPAFFAICGAIVAAIVIWRIVKFLNAIGDRS